jgi:hypothetical protein
LTPNQKFVLERLTNALTLDIPCIARQKGISKATMEAWKNEQQMTLTILQMTARRRHATASIASQNDWMQGFARTLASVVKSTAIMIQSVPIILNPQNI